MVMYCITHIANPLLHFNSIDTERERRVKIFVYLSAELVVVVVGVADTPTIVIVGVVDTPLICVGVHPAPVCPRSYHVS